MPFIKDEGEIIPDSNFILDHLVRKHALERFECADPAAIAFKHMVEESLYHAILYSRWVDPEGYRHIESEFKDLFPMGIGRLALRVIRRDLRKQSLIQGTARHSAQEVYSIGRRQIRALSSKLDQKEYFFEDKLTTFDATAFGFLETLYRQPFPSPLKDELLEHKNLCDYVLRLGSQIFGKESG